MPTPYTPGSPPGRHGIAWNAEKRILSFFAPYDIESFRADPPQAWSRTWYDETDSPGWTHSLGRRLHVGSVVAQAERNRKRRAFVEAHNLPLAHRPGLDAQTSFYDAMQPEARAAAAPVGGESWRVYAMVVRCPHSLDLALTNPALAVGLATRNQLVDEHRRVRWAMRTVRRLARRRRREIAGALGLPATKATVRLLARVPPGEAARELIGDLQPILADPRGARMLSHLPRLTRDAVTCSKYVLDGIAGHSLLEEFASQEWRLWHFGRIWTPHHPFGSGEPRTMLRDVVAMAEDLNRRLPLLTSWAQLCQIHDDLAEESVRRARDRNLQATFAAPPIAGTDDIVPLTSAAELAAEAAQQRNCLASTHFVRNCLAGDYYVYRVLHPERASLGIRRGAGGRWQVAELNARFNARVKPQTRQAVQRWLYEGQMGARRRRRPERARPGAEAAQVAAVF